MHIVKMLLFVLFGIFFQVAFCEWDQVHYDPEELNKMPGYGKSWMYIPDGDGVPRMVFLKGGKIDIRQYRDLGNDITYNVYTRNNANETHILKIDNKDLLKLSNMDLKKDIKFVTHGFQSSNQSNTCQQIKDAYLRSTDSSVIIVDWSPLSKDIIYTRPAESTKYVGQHVARMMEFLVENGASFDKMHCVGHSLGAQVCGYAGTNVGAKLGRITGLDPAQPLFSNQEKEGKLESTDAKFVDIIHTCAGLLGYSSNHGHVDFYPNGGTPAQPGCPGLSIKIIEACSHGRSWQYFAASILDARAFPSKQCASWNKYKNGDCQNSTSVYMGEFIDKKMRGSFYLYTTAEEPFKSI